MCLQNPRAAALALLSLAVCGLTRNATAQKKPAPPSPTATIQSLYTLHKEGNGPIFTTKGKALLPKLFDTKLAQLLWKNISETPKGSAGNLDFDPLYDAQDTKITAFVIGKPSITGSHAKVLVTFKNFNEPHKLTFQLVKTASGWRVQNIVYGKGHDLIKTLSAPIQ